MDKFRIRDERCFVCGDESHASKNCPKRRSAVAQWREEVERAKRAVEDSNPRMPWESDEDEDEETPGDAYKRWTREEEERLVAPTLFSEKSTPMGQLPAAVNY